MSTSVALMHEPTLVHVAMGELKVARRGETLTALLGSCVAIGVLWRAGGRCALAHCLLPSGPGSHARVGARYIDQAVPSLLALLGARDNDKPDLEIILAGGASMLAPARVMSSVGKLNVAAARTLLSAHGLRISHEAVGGRQGRQVRIDGAGYGYAVKPVEPYLEELLHAGT